MEYLYDLKEMLCEELEKIAGQGELNAGSLDTIQKLTHSLKSVLTIMAMEEEYSNEGGSSMGMSNASYRGSSRGGSYRGGSSRAYSRRGSYRRGRSRDDDADKMVEKLERMMEQTSDPSVKQAIQQAVESLEM